MAEIHVSIHVIRAMRNRTLQLPRCERPFLPLDENAPDPSARIGRIAGGSRLSKCGEKLS
jgi:hypothetical protein